MSADIKALVTATDKEIQYDEYAKHLLGRKIILAHILKSTIDEFKEMDPKDITYYIEDEPFISKVPVDPGYTNTQTTSTDDKVIGFNTENVEINEGLVRFDIIFYVRMTDGLSQIIVNVEKDEPTEYHILNRAIFYICRMISSQKGRDFAKSNYNDIRRVYSIWVCMNMKENSINHIHLISDSIIGTHDWKGDLNLLNIVMIGLTNDLPPQKEQFALHRFLGALLSPILSVNKKLKVLEDEYDIPVNGDIGKEVGLMCNLSQGVREEGWRAGLAEGQALLERMIIKMYKKGYTLEQIADVAEKTEEEILAIVKSREAKTIIV